MKKLTIILLLPLFISGQIPKGYMRPVMYSEKFSGDTMPKIEYEKGPIRRIWRNGEYSKDSVGSIITEGYGLAISIPSEIGEELSGIMRMRYDSSGTYPAFIIDSLWTETPAIKDASTAAVTIGQEFTTSAGRLKAIKFWKNETAGNYVVTLWHPNGASLFSQQYKSTTTGWQKITMDLPLESGTYVIGVYFPNGKYVYTNGLNPRTRTNLTGNKGLFSGGNSKPSGSYTASFFIDAVIEYSPTVPLSVKTSPDREATMPKDSVGVSATATGYTKFQWTVEDFEGRFTLKDTNTLKPYVIPLDSSGCRVWLFCTVTDGTGNQLADAVAIRVAPHPKMVMGYYLIDGSFKWRVPPTFIEFPQPATYVRP